MPFGKTGMVLVSTRRIEAYTFSYHRIYLTADKIIGIFYVINGYSKEFKINQRG